MPHQDFVRPDGQWPPEFVLTPGDLRRFDIAQYQALDGDAGGTWVPLTPITIGGQGLVLTGGASLGHTFSGGVLTLSGGRVYLGASIYPTFQTPVSRVIVWQLAGLPFTQLFPVTSYAEPTNSFELPGLRFSRIGGVSIPVPSRELHNGATIASANVSFQVGKIHSAIPTVLPQALLVRSDWKPWQQTQWAAGASYASGALVVPTAAFNVGWPYVYAATGAGGTAGGAEPNWATALTIGSTVVDGGVTWVNTGYAAAFASDGFTWLPSIGGYTVGIVVIPRHANGLLYAVTSSSGTRTTAATEPVWPLTPGATVIDNPGANQVVWTCLGTPRGATWTSGTAYLKGSYVSASPDNGMYYLCTTAGTSGGGSPAWGTTVGGTTADNTVVWTCLGSNPIGAGSIATPADAAGYFNSGNTQTLSVPCHGATTIDTVDYSYAFILYDESGIGAFQSVTTSPWSPLTAYALSNTTVGPFVEPNPANGFYYGLHTSGTSDATPPAWPTVIGAIVTESGGGAPSWQCLGSTDPSRNLFMSVAFSFTSIADMRPE